MDFVLKNLVNDLHFLHIFGYPRYLEDGKLNGIKDEEGSICFIKKSANGSKINYHLDMFINLKNGQIDNWRIGDVVRIHYKICDNIECFLCDDKYQNVVKINVSSVPSFLNLEKDGYGDYLVFNIDKDGFIQNWHKFKPLFNEFIDYQINEEKREPFIFLNQ